MLFRKNQRKSLVNSKRRSQKVGRWVIALFSLGLSCKRARGQSKDIEQIVLFIQTNRLQSLTEAIEANPELLHLEHKRRSLLFWCSHYNNPKAQMLVVHLTKKYPREGAKVGAKIAC